MFVVSFTFLLKYYCNPPCMLALCLILRVLISGSLLVGLEVMSGGNWCRGYVFEEGHLGQDAAVQGIYPLNFCWEMDASGRVTKPIKAAGYY